MDVAAEESLGESTESFEMSCKSNMQKLSDGRMGVCGSYFDGIPNEILHKIFDCLELEERIIAEQVCNRWYSVLSGGGCPLEDVVVFNIFEKSVWDSTVSKNASSQVKAYQMRNLDDLRHVIKHISVTNSIKLWFMDGKFANKCIDIIAESSLRMKSVDVFTYSASHILVHLHERLPYLEALTMRPHSSAFFWSGLDLAIFPAFSNLTTLIIDNYNLLPEVELPSSIVSFEFSNRGQKQYLNLLPKLSTLKNLEVFTLSHADISNSLDFFNFLNSIRYEHLPKLIFLTLRLCQLGSLNESFVTEARSTLLLNLKMLKLDLCYGKLTYIVRDFIEINNCLSILSLNVLCQLDTLSEVCYIADLLQRRRVGLHLAILQNYSEKNGKDYSCASLHVPAALFSVMTKFEASFVEDVAVFRAFLMTSPLKILREVKLVECCAIDNEVIAYLAKNSPLLRKLTLKKCENITEAGIIHFVLGLSTRLSKELQVTWSRDRRFARPASFYLELVHSHKEILKGKRTKFFTKTFSETDDGEYIVILDREKGKTLIIRDYSEQQTYRIVGVVIPSEEECHESDDQNEELVTDDYTDQLKVEQVKIT